jgi:hypothetical protein
MCQGRIGDAVSISSGRSSEFLNRRTSTQAALLAAAGVLLTVSSAHAGYTFIDVADTTMAAPSGMFTSFDEPSISNGVVAFQGYYNGISGLFTGNGGTLTTIAQTGAAAPTPIGTFAGFSDPVISGGTVAFLGFGPELAGGGENTGVFTGNGGALTTIAKTGDASPAGGTFGFLTVPSISNGTVAFVGSQTALTDSPNSGVFTGNGGALTTIAETGQSAPSGTFTDFYGPAIDNGTVAFTAGYGSSSSGVFTGTGGALTTIVNAGDPAPAGTFSSVGSASISGGKVAVYAHYNGGTIGVFTGSGGTLTPIAETGEVAPDGTYADFDYLSIIGNTVAFEGIYKSEPESTYQTGIFIGSGAALTPVIKIGDTLFGGEVTALDTTVTELVPSEIQDSSGDIAFSYQLSNGVSGVAIAHVPEPASLSLLGIGALGLLRRRRQKSFATNSFSSATAHTDQSRRFRNVRQNQHIGGYCHHGCCCASRGEQSGPERRI